MAKKGRKKKAKELTRKEIRRSKKARRQERMILAGVIVVALVVVALLAFGSYQEYIAKPREPVAMVGGVPIRTDTYEKMVDYASANLNSQLDMLKDQLARLDPDDESTQFMYQYYQQQIEQLQSQLEPQTLGEQVLDDLIDEELIRQEAARRGIVVTPEEVQLEIETQFGYERNPPTPTPTPITTTLTITPTPTIAPVTLDEFQERYATILKTLGEQVGFSEADFRHIFEAVLLQQKLQEAMGQEVPTIADQVHARQVQVENEEQAEAILALLEEGTDEASALNALLVLLTETPEEVKTEEEIRAEKDPQKLLTSLRESDDPFAFLAQNFSKDTSNKDQGGELGWFSKGTMVAEFEEAAFNTPPGEFSEAVETQFGWHVILVHETAEEPEPQVWASHILVDTEEEAQAILTLLEEGIGEDIALSALDVLIEAEVAKARAKEEEAQELLTQLRESDEPFAFLAENFSGDWMSKDQGGDMDWFPRGEETPEFEEAAFSLAVGEISKPISNTIGYHVIQVLGHEERKLESSILEQRKTQAFEDWLAEQRQSEAVERYWSLDKVPPDTETGR
jgi:parvulin-like peptidyl-prolyl isomerase